ncbi:MAG TPA: M28 family peptidase [Candidatus Thalassarchaeaceae archaeon]|nr:M28 family peptidase [Candidatus Thalassarchaeaceae archaeon]
MVERRRSATLLVAFLSLSLLSIATLAAPIPSEGADDGIPESWPEGSAAYDNMVTMTQFGYRRIDTQANENARNWIAEELEGMGYEVERQPFATAECNNCENIVVTINGTIDDTWYVLGSHHDAICYSPPPIIGTTYLGCTSQGAYDDGTGSGSLLELARTFSEWNGTPTHTWKLGWWDYEEWQGSGSSEGGGKGSLHFVEEQIPNGTNVTYVNLDMFALNWPVPTPAASQATGCDEDYWTLYQFTSPVDDWSYYENEGLEVTEEMQSNAEWFQNHLKEINDNLSHPEPWVSVIDDTKGNSDHYNFIMAGHTATWIRGQHQYIFEEGDTCEQTPKHAQTDSVTTINTLAGGRPNVESGLQTGLDIVATHALWDWDFNATNQTDDELDAQGASSGGFSLGSIFLILLAIALAIFVFIYLAPSTSREEEDSPISRHDIGEDDRFRDLWFVLFYLGFSMPFAFLGYWGRTLGMAEFGLDKYTVAAMFMVVQIPFFLRPLWAQPVDRMQTLPWGRRRSWMLYGTLGHLVLLMPLVLIDVGNQPWLWIAVLIFALVPRLFAEQAVSAMMAESVPQLGRANSMINLAYRGGGHLVILLMGWWIGGGGASPFISDGITNFASIQVVTFLMLLLVMASGIGITLMMKEGPPLSKAEQASPFPEGTPMISKVLAAMQTKTAWLVLLGCILLPLGDGFEAWFSAYLVEVQDMDGAQITLWWNVFAVINYLGLAGPWLSDIYGRKRTLRMYAIGSVVCYLLLGTSMLVKLPGIVTLIIWIPTLVLTDCMMFTFITTWADVADPRMGGTHMSVFQTAQALSATFVMVGLGGLVLLATSDAYWLLFMLAALGPALGWLIFSNLKLGEDELGSDPWEPRWIKWIRSTFFSSSIPLILDAELEVDT